MQQLHQLFYSQKAFKKGLTQEREEDHGRAVIVVSATA